MKTIPFLQQITCNWSKKIDWGFKILKKNQDNINQSELNRILHSISFNTFLQKTKTRPFYYDEKCINPKYKNVEISYKENSEGFRLYDKAGGSNIIACFGCSNTYGVGLPDSETWPYLLWKKLGQDAYTVYNIGSPGASNDRISRLVYSFLKQAKPKAIFCLFPDIIRKEAYSETSCEFLNFLPVRNNIAFSEEEYTNLCNTTDINSSLLNFIKNYKFIETLCYKNNVKFLWHTWSLPLLNIRLDDLKIMLDIDASNTINTGSLLLDIDGMRGMRGNNYEKARDGDHHGAGYNRILATKFSEVYYKQIMV